jgi:hypothetical protein
MFDLKNLQISSWNSHGHVRCEAAIDEVIVDLLLDCPFARVSGNIAIWKSAATCLESSVDNKLSPN